MGAIRPLWLRMLWMIGLVLAGMSLYGQEMDSFQPLMPKGQIPQDFILSSREKHDLAMNRIAGEEEAQVIEVKSEFYEESAYYLNQLLLSGKVLYNDEVSTFIQEVADKLLQKRPELRKQLRFYAVKSPSANAFSTNDGLILFNVGLVARLESEAQLAYILAHEISHYIKKHPLAIFMNSRKNRKVFGGNEWEEELLARNNYTREKEQEADLMGLEIYLETAYSLGAVMSTFDVLKNSHLPFANQPFDRTFLETEYLKFPDTYFLEEVVQVSDQYRNFDESSSTHPSPDARKEVMREHLARIDSSGRSTYLLGRDRFEKVREVSRFESAHLLLQQQHYEAAIYSSYCLLKQHPQNFFLRKVVAQSLYGLSRYADEGKFWDVHIDFDDVEGAPQQLHHLIEKLEDDELNLTALLYTWKLFRERPVDEELDMMVDDLMLSLCKNYVDDLSYFSRTPYVEGGALAVTEKEKLRSQYALVDVFKDTWFLQRLERQFTRAQEEKAAGEKGARDKQKEQSKLSLKGFNLGLNRVVFVDPYYKRVDQREENSVQFLDSEEAQQFFIDQIYLHSSELGLESIVLSASRLGPDSTETFKDLLILNQWITEKSNYEDLQLVSMEHEEVQYLQEKYGTRYFAWAGAVSLTSRKPNKILTILAGVVLLPTLPYAVYSALSPRHDTFLYLMVYDIEKSEYLILFPKYLNMADSPDIFNSVMYDLLLQIKSP